MKKFRKGTQVRIGKASSIPLRYQGRLGWIEGTQTKGRTLQYLVHMGPRRANALPVAARYVKLA